MYPSGKNYDEYLASVPTMVLLVNIFAAGFLIGASDTGYRTGTDLCFKTKVHYFLFRLFWIQKKKVFLIDCT